MTIISKIQFLVLLVLASIVCSVWARECTSLESHAIWTDASRWFTTSFISEFIVGKLEDREIRKVLLPRPCKFFVHSISYGFYIVGEQIEHLNSSFATVAHEDGYTIIELEKCRGKNQKEPYSIIGYEFTRERNRYRCDDPPYACPFENMTPFTGSTCESPKKHKSNKAHSRNYQEKADRNDRQAEAYFKSLQAQEDNAEAHAKAG